MRRRGLEPGLFALPVELYCSPSQRGRDRPDLQSVTLRFFRRVAVDTDLDGANLTGTKLAGANLTYSEIGGVTWNDTTCPDGTNSNNDGSTCVNNLS